MTKIKDSVTRKKRHLRAGASRTRRTARDLWILEAVGKLRFMTTTQLAQLHFGSRWGANKRLRKLLDAGLLRVWVRGLSAENIYSLDRGGVRLLAQEGSAEGYPVPRGLDGNLEHLLAINQVRITLAVTLPDADGEIVWWRSDWELREGSRRQLVPDALFEVRWGEGEPVIFALEVDNGKRSPTAFVRKALGYEALCGRDWPVWGGRPVVLAVGREERWIERYRLAICAAGLRTPIWFTALGGLEREGAEGRIWSGAEGEVRYSLREASLFPYSKEGVIGGTNEKTDV